MFCRRRLSWWRGLPSSARLAGGCLEVCHEPVGLSQKFLDVVKPGPAGSTRAQVVLNLFDFVQLQFAIEQRVERALIKMRHSSLVLPSGRPRPTCDEPAPMWFRPPPSKD